LPDAVGPATISAALRSRKPAPNIPAP
jgi:hypothetical protein